MKNHHNVPYRWVILALLFLATTHNYVNRIVLSVLLPEIEKEITMNPLIYGFILSAFQFTYTIGLLLAGFFIDHIGTRLGYLISIIFWSFASTMHGLCGTGFCLAAWRGILGITASGNFPAAIKTVAEWFKVEDRAFATSLFNSGSSISSIIGPPLIALIALNWGWRWAFVAFGGFGIFIAIAWLFMYKSPQNLPISSDAKIANEKKWKKLFREPKAIGIMLGKFLTDPVWWFYLYWMPIYLNSERGFDLKGIAIAIPLIYSIATLLGFVGGWMPGFFMRRNWSVRRARQTTMLFSAGIMPLTAMAVLTSNPWIAILLVSLACGAHNSWSANIFTMCSDVFPQKSVASVTGLGGFAGGVGGIIFSALVPGFVVQYFGYIPVFILMGILHPLGFVCVRMLVRYNE